MKPNENEIIKIDEDGVYKHTMLHALQNVHLIFNLTPTAINVIYLKLFYGEFCLISGKSFRRKRAEKCKKKANIFSKYGSRPK